MEGMVRKLPLPSLGELWEAGRREWGADQRNTGTLHENLGEDALGLPQRLHTHSSQGENSPRTAPVAM